MKSIKIPTIVLLLSLAFQNATGFASEDTVLTDAKTIQENAHFRKSSGLDSNENTIKKIIKENPIKTEYGYYLTKEEKKSLDDRFTLQRENKPKIVEYAKKDNSFAWLYIDQANGGIINVGFKAELDGKKHQMDEIVKIYGDGSKVKFHKATYTERELNEINEKIFNMRDQFLKDGIKISTSSNIIEEVVEVRISPYNFNTIHTTQKLLNNFPIKIAEREELELNARSDKLRPLQGGLEIKNPLKPDDTFCSIGFMGKKNNNYILITAGHCGNVGNSIYQGGELIGTITGSNQGGTNDSATIPIDPDYYSKYVYKNSSKDTILTSAQASNSDNVGDKVCLSGRTSGYTCGYIKSTTINDSLGNYVFQWVRQADYVSGKGDSGGSIFDGSTLKGVHFASTGSGTAKKSYFSHVSAILTQWNMTY